MSAAQEDETGAGAGHRIGEANTGVHEHVKGLNALQLLIVCFLCLFYFSSHLLLQLRAGRSFGMVTGAGGD